MSHPWRLQRSWVLGQDYIPFTLLRLYSKAGSWLESTPGHALGRVGTPTSALPAGQGPFQYWLSTLGQAGETEPGLSPPEPPALMGTALTAAGQELQHGAVHRLRSNPPPLPQSFSRTDRLLRHKRMCQGCPTKTPDSQLLL